MLRHTYVHYQHPRRIRSIAKNHKKGVLMMIIFTSSMARGFQANTTPREWRLVLEVGESGALEAMCEDMVVLVWGSVRAVATFAIQDSSFQFPVSSLYWWRIAMGRAFLRVSSRKKQEGSCCPS